MENDQTWESVVERHLPQVEVLNFGVGGYGTDQSFLQYSERGTNFHPHLMLLGFMSENIARNVNVFRPFYLEGEMTFPHTKPRFVLNGNELTLVPNPIQSIDDYRRVLK